MKIVAWNVNSIRSRLDRVCAFLEREKPDALCLQELKCEQAQYPDEAFRQLGYHSFVYGQKTWNGVAILTPHPIAEKQFGFPSGFDSGVARIAAAKIQGVWVVSSYVPNGQEVGSEKFDYKLKWLDEFEKYLANFDPKVPLAVCGDFNIAPADIDCHAPDKWEGKVLFSEQEKAAFERLIQLGFKDTFRALHPDTQAFSWWDYRMLGFQKNRGMRIDFVLANATLAEACVDARIDREERKGEKPSDHAPMIAVFERS